MSWFDHRWMICFSYSDMEIEHRSPRSPQIRSKKPIGLTGRWRAPLCLSSSFSSLLFLDSVNWQRPVLNSNIVLVDTFEHVTDRCWTRLTLPVKSVFDQLITIAHWCQRNRISLVSTRWMRTAPSIESPFNRFQYTQFRSLKISSV